MHEGDMYVFKSHIPLEMNSAAVVNPDGRDSVQGCLPYIREPHGIGVQWIAPTQMLQVAPGHKWCGCCGDVRAFSYFDPDPERADGYDIWCKQCRNEHDPRLRPSKYCSGCKQEKRRNEFSPDERNRDGLKDRCKTCRAEAERVDYQETLGRPTRRYDRHAASA